ncbi:hypothetical protein [Micromonospora craniellae]|nr:hypothetical protein [Micromonospora craniellae]QOC93624.1 hypothetical protein ID554_08305 [Micromonospora craniellae]
MSSVAPTARENGVSERAIRTIGVADGMFSPHYFSAGLSTGPAEYNA